MPQAQSFYEGRSFVQGLIWWFVMGRIGQGLRERYEVPKDMPPKLIWLVRKLDDDRDWLFPSVSWDKEVDFVPENSHDRIAQHSPVVVKGQTVG